MKIIVTGIILFFLITVPAIGQQRVVNYQEGMQIPINVNIGSPPTEVVFPDIIVDHIPGVSSQYLSLEFVSNRVYLQPLAYAPKGGVVIITQDGYSYVVEINTVEEGWDKSVKILNPAAKKARQGTVTGNRVMDMMRAMITNSHYDGLKVEEIPGLHEVWRDSHIVMLLEKEYTYSNYKGYKLQVINITDSPVVVPIQEIYFPNLLAVEAEPRVLEKKGSNKSISTMHIIKKGR